MYSICGSLETKNIRVWALVIRTLHRHASLYSLYVHVFVRTTVVYGTVLI